MLVTIGISFFNDEADLPDALRSVYAQSFDDWELLLVDDGSTDRSPEIAAAVAAADPRVRFLRDGRNLRLGARLNQIADLAQGRFIARMDADDLMHPDRLRLQVSHLLENPGIDQLGSASYGMNDAYEIAGVRYFEVGPDPMRSLMRLRLISHPNILGPTEWFRRNRYDESLPRSCDMDLWARTCTTSRFDNLREPLMFRKMVPPADPEMIRRRVSRMYGTFQAQRKIYFRHAGEAGWPFALRAIGSVYAREAIYRLANLAGQGKRLREAGMMKGFDSRDPEMLRRGRLELERVLGTAVPGLDSRTRSAVPPSVGLF
jgi:glycosyltransferase involved in cell wall biosynthesis